jgi:1-deoxy-D-xylulose-5-phosphate reductoisomerase
VAASPLTFEPVRVNDFPALELGLQAGRAGGLAPAVYNAANEQAVALFLSRRIGFRDIPRAIYAALASHKQHGAVTRASIDEADADARRRVLTFFE